MYCAACGSPLPEKAAFCPTCGAKVQAPPQAGSEKPNGNGLRPALCSFCGSGSLKKVRKGEYICESCGRRFFAEDPAEVLSENESEAELLAILAEAEGYMDKGDYRSELRVLSRGLSVAPDNTTLLLRLGRVCNRLAMVQEAKEYYRRAEETDPDDPIVYTNQASLWLKQGQYDEAKRLFETAIRMIEADPMSASVGDAAVTYGNYGWCLGKLGDMAGAKKYLARAKKMGYSRESLDYICRDLGIWWI